MTNPFENITAADFDRSSARDERPHIDLPFNAWVEQYLETARIAYEASEGQVDPWVVLSSPQTATRRLFTPDPDETNAGFYSRMQREARSLEASLVFVAMIARSTFSQGAPIPTSRDLKEQEGEFDPIFQDSILWYAESKDEAVRYGMIPVHLGRAGEVIENDDPDHEGASPLFMDILR